MDARSGLEPASQDFELTAT